MRFKSKKRLIGAFCMISTLFLAFSGTFPTMRTGAPGDSGTCANCHSNNGAFSGQINMIGIPGAVNGGDVLTITTEVEVTSGSPVRSGFSVVAIDDTNENQAGDWLSGDGAFIMSGGREYWGHQPALMYGGGSTVSWEADWEAPSITDDVTFYICAVIGNGSGTGGDVVECVTETISVSTTTAVSVIIDMEEPATCDNSADGGAEAVASDGTPPYEFEWDNGETTAVAEQLEPGTHTVTVTDDNGDTAMASTFIETLSSISLDADISHINCHGIADGIIDVIASGGEPPYNCSWDNLPDGCFHNNLAPGDYFVTVTDNLGCTQEEIFTIDDIDPLDLGILATDESIAGAMDGSITTSVDGGATPYDYNWSNGAITADLIGISAGVYSVTITDDNSCTASATVTISTDSTPCALAVNQNIMDAACYEGLGGIGLVVMGANGALSYNWSDGSTGANLANAPAGAYSVTVSDAANCEIEVLGMQIGQPDSLALNLVNVTDASCAGVNDGGLIVSASGGVGDYVLSWGFGLTNDTIINGLDTLVNIPDTLANLSPQIYPYSLVDGNGCITNGFYQVNNADSIAPVIMLQQGMVILDANGNAPAATFSLVDGGSFDNCGISNIIFDTPAFTCSDIGINNYTVFVSDASGNTSSATASIQVFETTPPVIDCSNSSAAVSTCGAVNYTIPTATDNCDIPNVMLVSGLQSGSIFPTGTSTIVYAATDECGNSSTCDFTVSVTNDFMVSSITTPATCANSTGTIEIIASGGTPPYTYTPFGPTQSNLAAGSYFITVSDNSGCEVVEFATIEQSDGPSLEFTNVTGDDCGGAPDGSVTLNITGGTAPYSLSIDNGVAIVVDASTYTVDMLSGGIYSMRLSDANGCFTEVSVEITSQPLPMVALPDFQLTCFSDSIFVDFSSINTNYSYVGYPRFAGPGNYDVTVTDNATGCTALAQYTITSPPNLTMVEPYTNVTSECNFSLTEIITEVSGGVLPYDITTTLIGQDIAGPYQVSVIDANGCEVEETVTFNFSPSDALSLEVNVIYSCDNTIVVNGDLAGGCAPYTYVYTPVLADPPVPGDYSLQVEDANGVAVLSEFTILEIEPIVDMNVDIQIIGANPGGVSLDIAGGVEPYSFEWANEAGEVISNEQNLPAIIDSSQTVTLTVTDANGCIASFMYFVDMEVATVELDRDGTLARIYPNPVGEKVYLEFIAALPMSAEIYSTSGELLSKHKINEQKMNVSTTDLVPGLYFVKLDYGAKVVLKQFLKI